MMSHANTSIFNISFGKLVKMNLTFLRFKGQFYKQFKEQKTFM